MRVFSLVVQAITGSEPDNMQHSFK